MHYCTYDLVPCLRYDLVVDLANRTLLFILNLSFCPQRQNFSWEILTKMTAPLTERFQSIFDLFINLKLSNFHVKLSFMFFKIGNRGFKSNWFTYNTMFNILFLKEVVWF